MITKNIIIEAKKSGELLKKSSLTTDNKNIYSSDKAIKAIKAFSKYSGNLMKTTTADNKGLYILSDKKTGTALINRYVIGKYLSSKINKGVISANDFLSAVTDFNSDIPLRDKIISTIGKITGKEYKNFTSGGYRPSSIKNKIDLGYIIGYTFNGDEKGTGKIENIKGYLNLSEYNI